MQQKIEGADKLMVWHNRKPESGDRCTLAVIWKGDQRYVGIARVSDKDVFNRKKGREIAIGRAQHLFEVESGKRQTRKSDQKKKYMEKFLASEYDNLGKPPVPEFLWKEMPKDGQ